MVKQAMAGDRAAFGELIRRFQGLVYGLAYHQIGSFDDAQDIAQEVFIKAFRHIHQLQDPECVAAWLRAITTNECKMWLRRQRQTVTLEEAEAQAPYAKLAEEKWKREQRLADIRCIVATLPERSRLMVSLHYMSGLSQREIAQFLNTTPNAVAQGLHRARRQLKQLMVADIEESYAMNRLADTFADETLGRLSLYPVVNGKVMVADGHGDARGLVMAVDGIGSQRSYITLWMRQDDLADIIIAPLSDRAEETARGRTLSSTLEILKTLDMRIEEATLHLSGHRTCSGVLHMKQGDRSIFASVRPSDALALAFRSKARVSVEEAVVKKGNIGEDGIPVPDEDIDSAAHKQEYERLRMHDLLIDKAFGMLSVEDGIDTIRFRIDGTNDIICMWVDGKPDSEISLSLDEYRPGIEMVYDLARRQGSTGRMEGGDPVRGWNKRYKLLFSMSGDDARMQVLIEE